ncbi:hypothetical protein ACFOZ1_12685 [Gracilibacillus marinus]|uniref:Uncharacterized protein n=1 Tax=Gracilibacillus marinus TaxID=630535 RepID=A0ABV8W0P2_9BACI
MYLCFLCNGLEKLTERCPKCEGHMLDAGKVVDYYGDYAAYVEVETQQRVDGYSNSSESHQCVHIGVCSNCNYIEEIAINEKEM